VTEKRVPGPTPSGGAYGVVRYLDANGRPTNAADAVSLEFREFSDDDKLIAVTSGVLPPPDERNEEEAG